MNLYLNRHLLDSCTSPATIRTKAIVSTSFTMVFNDRNGKLCANAPTEKHRKNKAPLLILMKQFMVIYSHCRTRRRLTGILLVSEKTDEVVNFVCAPTFLGDSLYRPGSICGGQVTGGSESFTDPRFNAVTKKFQCSLRVGIHLVETGIGLVRSFSINQDPRRVYQPLCINRNVSDGVAVLHTTGKFHFNSETFRARRRVHTGFLNSTSIGLHLGQEIVQIVAPDSFRML